VLAWLGREQAGLEALRSRPALADPRTLLDARRDEVDLLRDRARRTVGHALDRAADDIGHQRARARALSPLATLQRGYAVLQDEAGHVVTSVDGVPVGAAVSVRVADGRLHATLTGVDRDPVAATPDEEHDD
jgi:exodeoxyribonuclease VII large subunit